MREVFRAAVRALQLPDDAALLKAMGQGELEAAVDEHDRAVALAPADVQAEIDQRAAEWEDAQVSAHIAGGTQDAEAQADAETRARDAAADLARLAVADAARREWAEAHTGLAARAEAAEHELRARGLAERFPVTDAEVAQASAGRPGDARHGPGALGSAQGRADRPYPGRPGSGGRADGAADPGDRCRARQVRHAAARGASLRPSRRRQAARARGSDYEAARDEVADLSARVDQLAEQEAERRAEMDEAAINEPAVHEPQAEPELESAWQPGDAQGYQEPAAAADAEPEMEIG